MAITGVELFTNGKTKVQQPPDAIGYQHFCSVVDDLEQALQHLAGMNVHPHRGPFAGGAQYRIAFISDPDGNIIELCKSSRSRPSIGSKTKTGQRGRPARP
jgi:catechol 2,3-dioxygenase-like lactoylglutathione lyase family enzyme